MSADPTTTFDPIAIGDEIKSHLDQAADTIRPSEEAKKAHNDHITAAAALLYDVQQNHPNELESMCKRIGVKKSRRDELLAIGGGRKTLEATRAATRERQARLREEKKKKAAEKAEADKAAAVAQALAEAQTKAATDPLQPDVSGDADNENEPDSTLDPTQRSARALKAFKVAALKYLPDMGPSDQRRALEFVSETIKQRREAA
jgi:hypothetical protein